MTEERTYGKEVLFDFVHTLSLGNPGALVFVMELLTVEDSASRDRNITALKRMDVLGIRGPKLYMLWNDCCDRDAEKAVNVMLNKSAHELNYALLGGRGTPFRD